MNWWNFTLRKITFVLLECMLSGGNDNKTGPISCTCYFSPISVGFGAGFVAKNCALVKIG